MPSAYLWPHVAAIVEEPWLPTIIYPATGIAGLWQAPAAPPGALGRLLGRTRAVVLTTLDQPLSTTALAAMTGLSPAGVSRHLLALRDAGLVATARHGHEVATAGPSLDPRCCAPAVSSTAYRREVSAASSACWAPMMVAAPRIWPVAIRLGRSASGIQRTSSASSASGAPTRSAPRAR
jgi:DNA-binding transcriptional ArsR family regulator